MATGYDGRMPVSGVPPVRRGLGLLDGVLILCIAAVMCWLCVLRSREHLLWADELLSFEVFHLDSLAGAMRLWWEGGDSGPALYYPLVWAWTHVFGLSALSVRLFSTATMTVALTFTWVGARRFFSLVPVAWAMAMVFLLPSMVRWQEINGRFYGLFLASAAFASLCFLLTADVERLRPGLLWLTACAHACLIGSHILGVLYSASLLAGMVALDALQHRFRLRLYVSVLGGWLMLAVSWHAIAATRATAKGDLFWTQHPHPLDLLFGWGLYNVPFTGILVGLGALALVRAVVWPRVAALSSRPVVFLSLSLGLAQLVLYVKSQKGLSLYADRYLLPVSIGTGLVLAASFDVLLPKTLRRSKTWVQALLGLVLLVPCAAFALRHRDLRELYPRPGVPESIAARIPPGMPVLVTQGPAFLLMDLYDPAHRYYYLLDWAFDLRPDHAPANLTGQRVMQNWIAAGRLTDRIEPCHAVLAAHAELDVLLEPGREDWFATRFGGNPAYAVEKVAVFSDWEPLELWHVRRVRPGPVPC